MPSPQKAVLLDLRVFLADNNIRRNTSAFSVNYGSESESVSNSSFSLSPSSSKTVLCSNPCKVLILRTSSPVSVAVVVRPAVVGDPPVTLTFKVSQLLVIDSNSESITVTNQSTTDTSKVIVQQG